LPILGRVGWPRRKPQPFSGQAVAKACRLRRAAVTLSVRSYCAVGCGQIICAEGGRLIDVEGDPRSPINEGTLCPMGANSFELSVNPHQAGRLGDPVLRSENLGRGPARTPHQFVRYRSRAELLRLTPLEVRLGSSDTMTEMGPAE
jgi:hypothetical protein